MLKVSNIGADPEFFLTEHGKTITSIGRIGGGKNNPVDLGGGFSALEDNVMAEYNIPPAKSIYKFVRNVIKGRDLTIKRAGAEGFNLKTHEFTEEELSHEQAREIGCSSDFCEFEEESPSAFVPKQLKRYCGGHVHIELPKGVDLTKMVRLLDKHLYFPTRHYDDEERELVYGQPSRYRKKPYGLEYRSLGAFWIKNEELAATIYEGVEKAIRDYNAREDFDVEESYFMLKMSNFQKRNL